MAESRARDCQIFELKGAQACAQGPAYECECGRACVLRVDGTWHADGARVRVCVNGLRGRGTRTCL
eukprot:7388192-Prymnesium_polylepis.1